MKNLIAYFEGAAKDLNVLIDEPTGSVEKMAAVLQANATLMNGTRKLIVKHLWKS